MAIDTNSQEFQLLLRQFEKGNVVLFAGAGFSLGAKNSLGADPPLGGELARVLAKECGWPDSGEDLPTVYDQAQKHLGSKGLNEVLARYYRDCKPANWHSQLASLFWYRIYTTNIDDVIEQTYRGHPTQKLDLVTCPAPYEDHDLWHERVQCVHLHGSVLDPAKGYTFTFEDFAGQTAQPNPWYQALADDMMSRTFLFVGTRLNEPPFYHYLSLRSQRGRGTQEVRAKAFVVSPNVSTIRRRQLEDHGFAVFDATGEEFFGTLLPLVNNLVPDRLTLLKNRYPHQVTAISQGLLEQQSELLRQFDFVTPEPPPAGARDRNKSLFFDGAEPTWDDIVRGLDAPREAMNDFLARIQTANDDIGVFLLVGHAGSGKSTLLKRMAFEISRAGHSVYFMKAPERLNKKPISDFLWSARDKRTFFFLDEAVVQVEVLEDLLKGRPEWKVTFILSDRPHAVLPRLAGLEYLKPTVFEMPYLNRTDSESIIRKLSDFGQLGSLQGRPRGDQLREFLSRSKKQLLVAMKEATLGRGFDAILTNEFYTLASDGARLVYAITCLTYMHGAPVRRRHVLACLEGSDFEKATVLASHLREVVVAWREGSDFLCPRHRVIAHQVATESAPPDVRQEAVISILIQLSSDITPQNIVRRTPEYIAYRGLINLDNMLLLFGEDYETISYIYKLKAYYGGQFLFWLQFGRAELYFDQFAIAENYLNQSLGIRDAASGNFQALHHMAVLFLKRALSIEDLALAEGDIKRGEEILLSQIRERGHLDTYPYEALVSHKLKWLFRKQGPRMGDEMEALVTVAREGHNRHPYDDRMRDVYQKVYRDYLMLAVPHSN